MGWRFLNSHRSTFFLRYTDLDSVIEDVVRLSRQRLESVERRLRAEEEEVSDTNLSKSEFREAMLSGLLPFSVWLQYAVRIEAGRSGRGRDSSPS